MTEAQKERFKSYSLWVSLASAILLLVQTVGRPLGLIIDEATYMSIVNSVLGVFVVLGIISHPAQNLIKSEESGTEVIQEDNSKKAVEDKSQDLTASKLVDKEPNLVKDKQNLNQDYSSSTYGSGITVDSKSNYDVSKDNFNVDENYNLSIEGRARLDNFRQELNNLHKM